MFRGNHHFRLPILHSSRASLRVQSDRSRRRALRDQDEGVGKHQISEADLAALLETEGGNGRCA